MSITVHSDVAQRSAEWDDLRRGILTASTIGQLITPTTIKPAANDKSRALIQLLASERITGWTEDTYTSHDMLRGVLDEPLAREHYAATRHVDVTEVGFIDRTDGDVRVGYSPDGLVGDDGLIEIKSRTPRLQVALVLSGDIPPVHMAQMQCGLWVTGRSWCDYVSWSGGLPMLVQRVTPDQQWVDAIEAVARDAEESIRALVDTYRARTAGLPATERTYYDQDVIV